MKRPKRETRYPWGHIAVRGVQADDPRVIYACGDSVRYVERFAIDTTERGARATSHTFDRAADTSCGA